MRIIKLSKAEFGDLNGVLQFFDEDIWKRSPPGKFQVTPRRIAPDGLKPNERLVITYEARIVFTALAATALTPNDGDEHDRYPSYFLIDPSTLHEADDDLREIEDWYRGASGAGANLVRTQGWVKLNDDHLTNQLWSRLRHSSGFAFPEEVADAVEFVEGSTRRITVNAYERSPGARRRCIDHYGPTCVVCDINFGDVYGEQASGFIHVHHLRPLSKLGSEYTVDPIRDLRPVCPNCHAVLHLRRQPEPYTIEDVQSFMQRKPAST